MTPTMLIAGIIFLVVIILLPLIFMAVNNGGGRASRPLKLYDVTPGTKIWKFRNLNRKHGIKVMGEGGEVMPTGFMAKPISLEPGYEKREYANADVILTKGAVEDEKQEYRKLWLEQMFVNTSLESQNSELTSMLYELESKFRGIEDEGMRVRVKDAKDLISSIVIKKPSSSRSTGGGGYGG